MHTGKGNFGKVILVRHKLSSKVYAMKVTIAGCKINVTFVEDRQLATIGSLRR